MAQRSTIFLRNITAIDYAFLDLSTYRPKGGSLQLSAMVSGLINDKEAVVVDFSKIKKTIKAIIDDKDHGFDHKFWVPCNYTHYNPHVHIYEEDGELELSTPFFNTICPTNSVRFCDLHNITATIQKHLQMELNVRFPVSDISIKIELSEDMLIPFNMRQCAFKFNYIHGLKNSSSWGCQNITHGHYSWLAICDVHSNAIFIPTNFHKRLLKDLHNAFFIWDENYVADDLFGTIVRYECERGYFETTYGEGTNIKMLPYETTVENLVRWFIDTYRDDLTTGGLKDAGAHSVYISEGLTKGSYQII